MERKLVLLTMTAALLVWAAAGCAVKRERAQAPHTLEKPAPRHASHHH